MQRRSAGGCRTEAYGKIQVIRVGAAEQVADVASIDQQAVYREGTSLDVVEQEHEHLGLWLWNFSVVLLRYFEVLYFEIFRDILGSTPAQGNQDAAASPADASPSVSPLPSQAAAARRVLATQRCSAWRSSRRDRTRRRPSGCALSCARPPFKARPSSRVGEKISAAAAGGRPPASR
eukprot:SAG31_NODE_1729_length_7427_cov_1.746725_5_plen_177_part_00